MRSTVTGSAPLHLTLLRAAVAVVVLAVAAGIAVAAEPLPLSFTVGSDRYEVPVGGLTRVGPSPRGGLDLCPGPDATAAIGTFTAAHVGATVTVAIGTTEVFHLQIGKPYAGGCINWPLHPKTAAEYQAMLTGAEADPVPSSPAALSPAAAGPAAAAPATGDKQPAAGGN